MFAEKQWKLGNSHGNSKHAWGSVKANVNVPCGQFQVDEPDGRIPAGRRAQPAAINVPVSSTCFDNICIPAYQEEYEQRCLDRWGTQSHERRAFRTDQASERTCNDEVRGPPVGVGRVAPITSSRANTMQDPPNSKAVGPTRSGRKSLMDMRPTEYCRVTTARGSTMCIENLEGTRLLSHSRSSTK